MKFDPVVHRIQQRVLVRPKCAWQPRENSTIAHNSICMPYQGPFKNYVDKVRQVGGQKMLFLSTFMIKNVHVQVGRQQSIKCTIMSTQLLNDPHMYSFPLWQQLETEKSSVGEISAFTMLSIAINSEININRYLPTSSFYISTYVHKGLQRESFTLVKSHLQSISMFHQRLLQSPLLI